MHKPDDNNASLHIQYTRPLHYYILQHPYVILSEYYNEQNWCKLIINNKIISYTVK